MLFKKWGRGIWKSNAIEKYTHMEEQRDKKINRSGRSFQKIQHSTDKSFKRKEQRKTREDNSPPKKGV